MLLFPDINVKYQRQISLIETCRFSFPPPRLSLGSAPRCPVSHWVLALPHRLSLGSGTDVKSLATFSSGPDPSKRPRRKQKMSAQSQRTH